MLVLDRGYPAHWLFALPWQQRRAFCVRLPLNYSPQVATFVRSAQESAVIIHPAIIHPAIKGCIMLRT